MIPNRAQLRRWLEHPAPTSDLVAAVRASPSTPHVLEQLRHLTPNLDEWPALTYTRYRMFEHTGVRGPYESRYMHKRAMLTRAVLEFALGHEASAMRDRVHDLMWSVCEETTWVFPAHEEQGPDFWDIHPRVNRTWPLGAHTMLTREPDSIDLFAAETGATLAEAVHLMRDALAPEVAQRVKHEVARHIFAPYLHRAREHWWHTGALNWNGVCNGAVGLAFLRLERDPDVLAGALSLVLEGFDAYLSTGFEADGGSIEGVGYWNYGLLYFTAVAELLREMTRGEFDLLADERMKAIARYPAAMLLSPGRYANHGDAEERTGIAPGIARRIAERTGERELQIFDGGLDQFNINSAHKLAIMWRNAAWWDGTFAGEARLADAALPDVEVVKFVSRDDFVPRVVLVAKAGHNDGHHSHCDIGSFILHVGGESLLCDPGRGAYSKEYFRSARYENAFNNSFGHSVPRIGGELQSPGPEFGGRKQFHGEVVEVGERDGAKFVEIEFARAYDIAELRSLRRTLTFHPDTGATELRDEFAFDGAPMGIEEAFVTWADVNVAGNRARIVGANSAIELVVVAPDGATFEIATLKAECRANNKDGVLKRLSVALPLGATSFALNITPA